MSFPVVKAIGATGANSAPPLLDLYQLSGIILCGTFSRTAFRSLSVQFRPKWVELYLAQMSRPNRMQGVVDEIVA